MNKISKTANKVFYIIIVTALFFGIGFFGFGFFKASMYPIAYLYIYVLIPLLIIAFLIILILNFKEFGLISGIKESSISIFTLLFSAVLLWILQNNMKSSSREKNNRLNVTVVNKTNSGISNITLVGRNAKTKIDTLAPEQSKTVVFKGKEINYETENDYENEIRILYYFEKDWRENKILSGFSRWRVINNDWEINIRSADSIDIKQL